MEPRSYLELKLDEDATIEQDLRSPTPDDELSSRVAAARLALATGNWTDGFADFELRAFSSPSDRPRWTGERLPAARVVVVAEESECDTLAFARFLPELAARVLSLTLAVSSEQMLRLSPFYAAFGGVTMTDKASLPQHDLVMPLASAPAALGLVPDDLPPPLALPFERKNGAAIGIALTPSPWSHNVETAPDGIVPLLRQAFPGRKLVALDKAAAARLGCDTVGYDPAMLAGLDLVVATDGPVAHAAGVMGTPLWLLLGDAPHWMWGEEGRFSRWYPGARLFRAEGPDWRGIMRALGAEATALKESGLSDIGAIERLATAAESVEGEAAAQAALPFAARLVALERNNPGAWARLAELLLRLGAATDADRVLGAGLGTGARHAPLLLLASRRDLGRGKPTSALQHAEQALGIDPGSVDALMARASALAALGDATRAEIALRHAAQAAPHRADLLVAWGEALRPRGDTRGASRAFERAVLAEDCADARLGLGRLAGASGELGLALHFLKAAVALDGGHVEAGMELARAVSAAGRTAEAIDGLRRLVARCPSPAARAFLGELLLTTGDFAAGLAEFEWRRGEVHALPALADLAGRSLVLVAEGTAGAMIRLLRFVPALRQAGVASVRLAGAEDLASLLVNVAGLDGIGEIGKDDVVLPIMSLPALLGLTVDELSVEGGYLTADPVAATNVARTFAHIEGFRVGLALGGGEPLDAAVFSSLSEAAFVALDTDAAAIFPEAWPLTADQVELDKIAAALPNLDAVIARASSPIAALAGALGRPTFVIGPDRDDWLWLEKDGRTPWFPTTRLFRRSVGEAETDHLSRLVTALTALAQGDRAIVFRADPAPINAASGETDDFFLHPGHALARAGLAALAGRDDHRAAILLGDAMAAGAGTPELREKLAAAFLRIGERDRAGSLLAALVAEVPTAERLVELSEAGRQAGRLAEALAHAERAVELRPGFARAHRAVGKAMVALGNATGALEAYERAVTLAPADPELLMDQAEALLMTGDYRRGFAAAEVRWRAPELLPRRFAAPRWAGEDISGRTLLVHGERDLGLDIAFARFLPQLLERGPRLVLEVRPALTDLFRRLEVSGNVTVIEQGRRLPHYDLEVPLRSLPHVFGTEQGNLPPSIRIEPDPLRVEAWRRLFHGDDRAAVGVYWKSPEDAARLAPLADLDDVRLFALDRRAGRASIASLPVGLAVESLNDRLGGFVEMAAAMVALDAVIAPVSATAHLAATLGRPAIVTASSATEWLWAGKDGTPWYPNVHVWHQGEDFADLLRGLVSERRAR